MHQKIKLREHTDKCKLAASTALLVLKKRRDVRNNWAHGFLSTSLIVGVLVSSSDSLLILSTGLVATILTAIVGIRLLD